jgi:hypothetical protein
LRAVEREKRRGREESIKEAMEELPDCMTGRERELKRTG